MKRIGIYGGTFNPPHTGHIQAAAEAVELLRLDKLILVPTNIAPHKELPENSATAQQRLEMLKLAAASIPKAEVSDMELQRQGTSYTYLTVQELKQKYPEDELVLLMGTDMFLCFDSWKNPQEIMKNAKLGVLYRGQKGEEEAIKEKMAQPIFAAADVVLVKNNALQISSTDLRRMLIFSCAGPFLPRGVEAYIREKGLFGVTSCYRNLTEQELENAVVSLLKPSRVQHVLGCRDTAVALAQHWGADPTDAARAGLLHDITKALDGPLQLTLCREYGILLDDFSAHNPKTLHALTGSLVADKIFGENEAVVDAIRSHTTGKANMNLLEKIIYVADYMEPNRDFPGVENLRKLAFMDIDGALKLGLEMTLELLKRQGSEISPESREALNFLNKTF